MAKKTPTSTRKNSLVLPSFSMVYLNYFNIEAVKISNYIRPCENQLRTQIFSNTLTNMIRNRDSEISCYQMPDVHFQLNLNGSVCTGFLKVELNTYFGKTAVISLRLMCSSVVKHSEVMALNNPATVDDVIKLMALGLSSEYWNSSENNQYDINYQGVEVEFLANELIDERITGPDSFEKLVEVYRKHTCPKNSRSSNFVMVDIWEDVDDEKGKLSKLPEDEIITKIRTEYQNELMGLMTQYPYEWTYRDVSAFSEVCGENIAIDIDDLVLVNENCCLVFGTYAKRGNDSPTDWKTYMQERLKHYISWPEYYYLLEFLLVKRFNLRKYSSDITFSMTSTSKKRNTKTVLEENSNLVLEVNKSMQLLNAFEASRFVSHKIMFQRTEIRLRINEEISRFKDIIDYSNQAISNLDNIREMKQAWNLNMLLGIIAVASMSQILFYELNIPIFEQIDGLKKNNRFLAMLLTELNLLLIVVSVSYFVISAIRRLAKR